MDASKRLTVKKFFEIIRDLDETVYQIQITHRFRKSLQ